MVLNNQEGIPVMSVRQEEIDIFLTMGRVESVSNETINEVICEKSGESIAKDVYLLDISISSGENKPMSL